MSVKTVLIISGFDPFNLAGYGSDIRVATKIGAYPVGVITSLTNQNPNEVLSVLSMDAAFIKQQLDSIFLHTEIGSIKIGMLYSKKVIEVVASFLKDFKGEIVVDPILHATKGQQLLDLQSVSLFKEQILKSATIITPNIPEAIALTGISGSTHGQCELLYDMFRSTILLKGGHGEINDKNELTDVFYDGKEFVYFGRVKKNDINTHGTGCLLSTAIASYLVSDYDKVSAIKKSQKFLTNSLDNPIKMGCEKYLSH